MLYKRWITIQWHKVHCYIIDVSIQIRARASIRDSLDKDTTYHQFCYSIVNGAVNSAKSAGTKRLDLVTDMYWLDSINGPTRMKRGTSSGVHFSVDDVLPKRSKLDQYLTNADDFKTDLNRLVLDVATEDLSTDLEIVITDGLKVMKISDGVQIREQWSDIKEVMEEADNRVLLHIKDSIECGVLSKQAGSGGTHFHKIKSLLFLTLVGKRIRWEN